MTLFKVGDIVECMDFTGASGSLFEPDKYYKIVEILVDERDDEKSLLCFSHRAPAAFRKAHPQDRMACAFAKRFRYVGHGEVTPNRPEYDEIIMADEIYSNLVDGG